MEAAVFILIVLKAKRLSEFAQNDQDKHGGVSKNQQEVDFLPTNTLFITTW